VRLGAVFHTVLVEEEPGTSDVVDVRVDVREAPPRDVRLGIGYDTDTGPRGIAGWRHYDFLGGGRQLGVTVRGSEIKQSAAIDFLQPHWPGASNRGRLLAAYQLQDEDSYDLMRSSFSPPEVGVETMIEWIADWIRSDGPMLGKPTHFEERAGQF